MPAPKLPAVGLRPAALPSPKIEPKTAGVTGPAPALKPGVDPQVAKTRQTGFDGRVEGAPSPKGQPGSLKAAGVKLADGARGALATAMITVGAAVEKASLHFFSRLAGEQFSVNEILNDPEARGWAKKMLDTPYGEFNKSAQSFRSSFQDLALGMNLGQYSAQDAARAATFIASAAKQTAAAAHLHKEPGIAAAAEKLRAGAEVLGNDARAGQPFGGGGAVAELGEQTIGLLMKMRRGPDIGFATL